MGKKDEEDKLIQSLRKLGKIKQEYPPELYKKRRESFIWQQFVWRFGCIFVAVIIVIIILVVLSNYLQGEAWIAFISQWTQQ